MTKKDKKGISIIIGVIVCILSIFTLSHHLKASANNYDHETLCRNDDENPVVKLLIDKTDPWEERDRERLARLIRRMKDSLAEQERLSIYILGENGTYSPSPVFDMCNPGRGDQANSLYENPRHIQKQFEEKFAAPLDGMLEDLLRPGIAPQSPILEAATGIRGKEGTTRLVIVSDMMQNTERASFYKGRGKSITSKEVADLCTMEDPFSEINVYYIDRQNITVSVKQDVRNFWYECIARLSGGLSWETL